MVPSFKIGDTVLVKERGGHYSGLAVILTKWNVVYGTWWNVVYGTWSVRLLDGARCPKCGATKHSYYQTNYSESDLELVLSPIKPNETKEESIMSTLENEAKVLNMSADDQLLFSMDIIDEYGELTDTGNRFMHVVAFEDHKDSVIKKAKAIQAARKTVTESAAVTE